MNLDKSLSEKAIDAKVGKKLGLDTMTAALGITTIADGAMSLAVRAVSVNRGIDPRDTVMIAFGGAGPLHACSIAREISIPKVIIPKLPGNFSALGMLMANWRQDFVRTLVGQLGRISLADATKAFEDLRQSGNDALKRDGLTDGKFEFAADLRYRGQEHTIAIPVRKPEDLSTDISATTQKFNAQHDRRYGHAAPDQSMEIVNLRLVVTIARMQDVIAKWMSEPWKPEDSAPEQRRPVIFDDPKKPVDAHIVWRPGLPAGTEIAGPAVIEEPNSTTWLPPGDRAVVDPSGHIVITIADRT
jgi:N-methylhydantoinase A